MSSQRTFRLTLLLAWCITLGVLEEGRDRGYWKGLGLVPTSGRMLSS